MDYFKVAISSRFIIIGNIDAKESLQTKKMWGNTSTSNLLPAHINLKDAKPSSYRQNGPQFIPNVSKTLLFSESPPLLMKLFSFVTVTTN